jgi:hypothetical protein
MDGSHFDRLVQRLGRRQLSRRAALEVSGLGLTSIMVRRAGFGAVGGDSRDALRQVAGTPAAHSTPDSCPAGPVTEVAIDGAWLCRQSYALCTTAACRPSPDDATLALCRCFVEDGYSIGFTSCGERKPSGKTVVSTFSTQNVTSRFHTMICPAQYRWANCLDVPCQVDPGNPDEALCRCPIVETGPSLTFGGACDTSTCSAVIWSAATPPGVTQYATAMACVNQPVTFPATCPRATPSALPAATPAGD